jgi:hypothetical protein
VQVHRCAVMNFDHLSLFGSLAALELRDDTLKSLALPLLGASRGYAIGELMRAILEQSLTWLKASRFMNGLAAPDGVGHPMAPVFDRCETGAMPFPDQHRSHHRCDIAHRCISSRSGSGADYGIRESPGARWRDSWWCTEAPAALRADLACRTGTSRLCEHKLAARKLT